MKKVLKVVLLVLILQTNIFADNDVRVGFGSSLLMPNANSEFADTKHFNFYFSDDDNESTFLKMATRNVMSFGFFTGSVDGFDYNNQYISIGKEIQFLGQHRFQGIYLTGKGGIGWKNVGGNETNTLSDDDVLVSSKAFFELGLALNYSNDDYTISLFIDHWSNGCLTSTNKGYNMIGLRVLFRV